MSTVVGANMHVLAKPQPPRTPATVTCRACGRPARRWSRHEQPVRYVCMACPDRPVLLDAQGQPVQR